MNINYPPKVSLSAVSLHLINGENMYEKGVSCKPQRLFAVIFIVIYRRTVCSLGA